jgi:RNA polymerase sigma factor (sigma-70 family)
MMRDHDGAIRRLAAGYETDFARRQDLVQDIWLALWQALPAFRGDASERTFVFRVAHNRALNHIRHWRMRRTETLDELAAAISDASFDPELALDDRQRRERLQAAVQQLPLGLRQVTVLMLEGLSHREIADVLGLSEGNVAVRLTRARAALSRVLEPTGARS